MKNTKNLQTAIFEFDPSIDNAMDSPHFSFHKGFEPELADISNTRSINIPKISRASNASVKIPRHQGDLKSLRDENYSVCDSPKLNSARSPQNNSFQGKLDGKKGHKSSISNDKIIEKVMSQFETLKKQNERLQQEKLDMMKDYEQIIEQLKIQTESASTHRFTCEMEFDTENQPEENGQQEELLAKVKRLENQVDYLKDQNKDLRNDNVELRKQLDNYKDSEGSLVSCKDYKLLCEEIGQQILEKTDLTNKIRALEKENFETFRIKKENEALHKEKETFQTKMAKLVSIIDILEKKLASKEDDYKKTVESYEEKLRASFVKDLTRSIDRSNIKSSSSLRSSSQNPSESRTYQTHHAAESSRTYKSNLPITIVTTTPVAKFNLDDIIKSVKSSNSTKSNSIASPYKTSVSGSSGNKNRFF